jgi:hypothetical protein
MIKSITLSKTNINYLVRFLILLTIATSAPLLGFHSQWITGSIVNMALILSVFVVGIRGALLIGMLPSTIALGTGLLPAILSPMIPFIIISNCILVLVFSSLSRAEAEPVEVVVEGPREKIWNLNYFIRLFLGAGIKYLFLFLTSGIVINLLLNSKVAPAVAQVMSWPQFLTAMIGGVLAFGILKFLPAFRRGSNRL